MQEQNNKKTNFQFQQIKISSNFESGNLQRAELTAQNQVTNYLKIYRLAYGQHKIISMQTTKLGVKQASTVTFTIVNMNNQVPFIQLQLMQVKLFKQGHTPVYKTQNSQWQRIKIPIAANGITKGQNGFQIVWKHTFLDNSKHYFAFTYPWTNKQNQMLISSLIQKSKTNIFCKQQQLCKSYKGRPLTLLTLTKAKKQQQLKYQIVVIGNVEIVTFTQKIGIFISSRVHPGQTASSHIMNGILKKIFDINQLSFTLLQNCVFYFIPIINPDGVAQGNFRTDSQGKNLNRYYTNPNQSTQPQIYHIKQFLLPLIKQKKIQFCLDLHAHVNKQNAFIYGNSTFSLYGQMRVCLFPKLLSFNNQIFDFDSCNFSEKNMSSKDKGDQLSKQGASRVAIFKQTGLVECWTLECNYNSARVVNKVQASTMQIKNSSISNGIICSKVQPQSRQQLKLLNISDFQGLGLSILQSISDFFNLKSSSRIFSSKLKNYASVQLNVAVATLRLIPFRFDTQCRKILDCLNSSVNTKMNLQKLTLILSKKSTKPFISQLGQQLNQNSSRNIKSDGDGSNSNSKSKRQQSMQNNVKKQSVKVNSLKKLQNPMSKQKNSQRIINFAIKAEQRFNKIPPLPKPKSKY